VTWPQHRFKDGIIKLPIVGSSDVGTPAALWALELDPSTQVSLVVSTTAEE